MVNESYERTEEIRRKASEARRRRTEIYGEVDHGPRNMRNDVEPRKTRNGAYAETYDLPKLNWPKPEMP